MKKKSYTNKVISEFNEAWKKLESLGKVPGIGKKIYRRVLMEWWESSGKTPIEFFISNEVESLPPDCEDVLTAHMSKLLMQL